MRGGRTHGHWTMAWIVGTCSVTYFYVNVQWHPMHERILNCPLQLQTPRAPSAIVAVLFINAILANTTHSHVTRS